MNFSKTLTSLLLTVVLVAAPTMTGCSGSDLVSAIDNAEQLLPQIAELATGITSLIAPEYAPLIKPAADTIGADGRLLQDLVQQYKALPSDTVLQKINALVQDVLKHTNAIVAAVGVKDPTSAGIASTFAGLIGVIINEVAVIASKAPPKTVAQLPAFFGWHIAGVELLAIDGSKLPPPSQSNVKSSGYKPRDVAKHWNKLCKDRPQARLKVPRSRVLGIPVPLTGGK